MTLALRTVPGLVQDLKDAKQRLHDLQPYNGTPHGAVIIDATRRRIGQIVDELAARRQVNSTAAFTYRADERTYEGHGYAPLPNNTFILTDRETGKQLTFDVVDVWPNSSGGVQYWELYSDSNHAFRLLLWAD